MPKTDDLASMESRLKALEAENRKVKLMGIVAMVVSLLLGVAMVAVRRSVLPLMSLDVEKLVIHDSVGRARVEIGTSVSGEPTIRLMNSSGDDGILLQAKELPDLMPSYYTVITNEHLEFDDRYMQPPQFVRLGRTVGGVPGKSTLILAGRGQPTSSQYYFAGSEMELNVDERSALIRLSDAQRKSIYLAPGANGKLRTKLENDQQAIPR